MSQSAIVLSAVGKPLHLSSRAIPTPATGEVLVKIHIASLNPHDAKSQSMGLFVKDSMPTPLAAEYIGTVTQCGPDVTKFKIGEVIVCFGDSFRPDEVGTQEYALATVKFASLIPKGVSLDEALTFPLNAQTSYFALFHSTGFGLPQPKSSAAQNFDYASKSILIIGGGASTGKFAIQFCRLVGFGNIITIASKSNEALLKSLGATHVLDRHLSHDETNKAIRTITDDDLLYALDVVHFGNDLTPALKYLSDTKKGTLVSIIGSSSIDETQDIGRKNAGYDKKNVFVNTKGYLDVSVPFWDNFAPWVEGGHIKPTPYSVIEGLNVDKVNDALEKYNSGLGNVVKPHIHITLGQK